MNDMTEREIRLRCIEAAAKAPIVHQQGAAAGVLEVAKAWEEWVRSGLLDKARAILGLPPKKP